ncbi:helix-turn-helix domain-containing protein [Streptomyces sp. NPDC101455]|uniref:helix-turn-helix domain-containing protein n=1 Tax=Streptomyces sp. NPDC101455 TaxID=3366142 RepID=UPI00382E0A94
MTQQEHTVHVDRTHENHGGRKRDSMLTRGLAILSEFRADDVELTLAQLSRRAGLPKPTAHRLIAELLDSGFLERGQRGLVLGRQLFVLGGHVPLDQKIRALALPHIQHLRRTGRTSLVYLSADRGHEVVHLLRSGVSGPGDEREKSVDLAVRRVLSPAPGPDRGGLRANAPALGPPAIGPVVRLENTAQACVVFACPVRPPGASVVAALAVVCPGGQDGGGALAKQLHRTAHELAACLATLPDLRAATPALTTDVSGVA